MSQHFNLIQMKKNEYRDEKTPITKKLCDFDLKTIETDLTYTADEYDEYMAQN